MKQEMMGWQCHQLDHMQIICTLLQADDHGGSVYRPDALPDAQATISTHSVNLKDKECVLQEECRQVLSSCSEAT